MSRGVVMIGNEFESMGRDCSEGGHEGPPRNNREITCCRLVG